jgi:DNA-binding NarL/FixJ family response regulator
VARRRRENTGDGEVAGKTTVVLAEAHGLVREAIGALLSREPDLEVVGEAARGREAVDLVAKLAPHVAVVDLTMPQMGGLPATRLITSKHRTKVVVLSVDPRTIYLDEALRSGATGYVLKDASMAELCAAIRSARAGRFYVCKKLAGVRSVHKPPAASTLTVREEEVVRQVAHGLSSKQIAAQLGISPRTAEAHRANAMRKLDARTQMDLVRYAVLHRLLEFPTK